MSLKDTLTNERLNNHFSNPFKLVTHAIHLAKEHVQAGEGMRSHLVTDILEEIADHNFMEEEDEE